MQAIMETLFEVPYLIGVVTLGILMVRMAKGDKLFTLFGIMAIILGCGDAFHLIPRMYALLTDGLGSQVALLGSGKLVTSITMTVFYVLLFHVWQERYAKKTTRALTICVYTLAAVRIALCLFPQNQWFSADAPLSWGIYRNVPFAALGLLLICLYAREAKRNDDHAFRFLWLAITLSFLFYFPVVLWADQWPMVGMLMLPKTCAYVWMVWMGYADARKRFGKGKQRARNH